jgi:proton-translocating NADH-quinone oxidoreductase chain L
LCSYLLVNFWYTREQANKSAMKAIIVNRIGDFFLFLALLAFYFLFKTFDFVKINSLIMESELIFIYFFGFKIEILTLLSFFLFFAAVGKSAQVGLHTWLPDAMEGPTPVSALIHAATMVTAGIFLILRSSFIIESSVVTLNLITIFGAITAILASTTGLFQYDIKKIIAYSTSSQLGYMFLACGTSNYNVAIFHLYNHAFFKALLFLGAGSVIHALNDEQDMRKMGGIFTLLPFTFINMLIGTIALIALPFLTGFYSKDLIIETLLYKYNLNFF